MKYMLMMTATKADFEIHLSDRDREESGKRGRRRAGEIECELGQ